MCSVFRDSICIIKRPAKTVVEGETIWTEPEVVYADVPCHLSVKSVNPVEQSESTADIKYSFKLFTDASAGVDIKANDIVEVTTAQGQVFSLKAGESIRYKMTTQTSCEDVKIV